MVEGERRFHSKQKAKTRQLKAYPWLLPNILAPGTELPPLTWSRLASSFFPAFFSSLSSPLPFHRGLFSFATLPSRKPTLAWPFLDSKSCHHASTFDLQTHSNPSHPRCQCILLRLQASPRNFVAMPGRTHISREVHGNRGSVYVLKPTGRCGSCVSVAQATAGLPAPELRVEFWLHFTDVVV